MRISLEAGVAVAVAAGLSCGSTKAKPARGGGCAASCSGTCDDKGRCMTTLATGQPNPVAIAVDSSNVYWTRAGSPAKGAVDATSVYWLNKGACSAGGGACTGAVQKLSPK